MKTVRLVSAIALLSVTLAGCDKYGGGGRLNQLLGNWTEVKLPDGCVAKQIAAEHVSGVVVLCEDGRIFH